MTPHFSRYETTRSATAHAMGIDNTPSVKDQATILCTAMHMEHVRHLLGDNPVLVTSWYRSPELNKAVGGVPDSAHRKGYAVDFHCPGYGTTLQVAQAIADSCLQFDQLIHEYESWVHISFDLTLRRQLLTKRTDEPYTVGLA